MAVNFRRYIVIPWIISALYIHRSWNVVILTKLASLSCNYETSSGSWLTKMCQKCVSVTWSFQSLFSYYARSKYKVSNEDLCEHLFSNKIPTLKPTDPWNIWITFLISNCHANFSDSWLKVSYEIALRLMVLHLTGDKSSLVQVMAWCRQATSHYPSQCCPRSVSLHGVTKLQ